MSDRPSFELSVQCLLEAFRDEFADRDDDDLIPVRTFAQEIGESVGLHREYDLIPEWETVGWLRRRTRSALAQLAAGEKIP